MLGEDISIAYLILKNSDRWSPPCSQKTAKKALNLKLPWITKKLKTSKK